VLLPATTGADAELVAHRIRTATANSPNAPPVTVSVGIAHVSADKRLTLQAADRAVYLDKQLGGDSVKRPQRQISSCHPPADRTPPPHARVRTPSAAAVKPNDSIDPAVRQPTAVMNSSQNERLAINRPMR